MRRLLLSTLVLVVVLGLAEVVGLGLGMTFGLLLLPVAPILVALGLAAGVPALVVGVVRRRSGAPAGGVSDGDLLVHGVLLVNTLLLSAALVGIGTARGDGADRLFLAAIATGAVALIGVPASVLCSWQRACLPAGPRRRNAVVALSHTASAGLALVVLAPFLLPVRTALLGSLAM